MEKIMIIGGFEGLPPGMKDLLERLGAEIKDDLAPDVEDFPMAQDLENAHKQNLELLRKVDELECKNKVISEDNKMLESRTYSSEAEGHAANKEIKILKHAVESAEKALNYSETRYKASLEDGNGKDERIAELEAMLEQAFKYEHISQIQWFSESPGAKSVTTESGKHYRVPCECNPVLTGFINIQTGEYVDEIPKKEGV